MPQIELTEEILMSLAAKAAQQGYTIPGVQKKLSLHLLSDGAPRLTIVDYPNGYILKPQVSEFQALPESEHLIMLMAERAGLSVVPHGLIRLRDQFAYLTRRVDRIQIQNRSEVGQLAMEDFCQLDLRMTQDKYRGSYERCAKVIQRYSVQVGLDLAEMYLRLIFCFLTGNSDMHLKNFSMMETEPESGRYVLSPAYDLLPVNVIMPEDHEELALTINGKKTRIRRKDFIIFAEKCGIPSKAAERMLDRMIGNIAAWIEMCRDSVLPEMMREDLIELIKKRAERIV